MPCQKNIKIEPIDPSPEKSNKDSQKDDQYFLEEIKKRVQRIVEHEQKQFDDVETVNDGDQDSNLG